MPTLFFSFLLLVLFVDILKIIVLPIALSQCAVIPFILVGAVSRSWVARVIVAVELVLGELVTHLVCLSVAPLVQAGVVTHAVPADIRGDAAWATLKIAAQDLLLVILGMLQFHVLVE